jgi:transcriptional regulator with XRE-family HTH domain
VNEELDVGKRIRHVRQHLKLTQERFGQKLGVKKLAVARYEAGRVPRFEMLAKIARIGGVSLPWLVGSESSLSATQELAIPAQFQELATRLLEELSASSSPIWRSKTLRKRYEDRSRELLSRSLRDLIEYRELLETGYRHRQKSRCKR